MRAAGIILALAAASPNGARADDHSIIGVMVDAGLPDGAAASIVVRPWSFLRAHAGVAHNLVSNGVRGGVTLIPFDTWLTVTLTAEVGRYPGGDANPLARRLLGDELPESALLANVGYDWASGHAGIEFGQELMTIYLHGGMTYLSATLGSGASELEGSSVRFTASPTIRGWMPSAKLGLILYLF